MWHALRTELAYSRSYLLGGLGLALGVAALITGIFQSLGDQSPPSHAVAGIRGMFMIMAPLIVGFIVQAYRAEERRSRLLLAGPLTPRQAAAVSVILPVILGVVGVLAAGLLTSAEALITGRFSFESVQIVGQVGSMLFFGLMIGLLIQEATAAHRERRLRAATGAWVCLGVAAVIALTPTVTAVLVQGPRSYQGMHLGNMIAAVITMAIAFALASGRTDFTH